MLSEVDAAERRAWLEPESLPATLRRAILARRLAPAAQVLPLERLSELSAGLISAEKPTRRRAALDLALLGPRALPIDGAIRRAWSRERNGRIRRILRRALRAARPSPATLGRACNAVRGAPLLDVRQPAERAGDLEALAALGLAPEGYGPVYQLARGRPEDFAAWAERWIAAPREVERRAQYRRSWVLAALGRLPPRLPARYAELWPATSPEARFAREACAGSLSGLAEVVNTGQGMELRRGLHRDPSVPSSFLGSVEVSETEEGLRGRVCLLYGLKGRSYFAGKSLAADLEAIAQSLQKDP